MIKICNIDRCTEVNLSCCCKWYAASESLANARHTGSRPTDTHTITCMASLCGCPAESLRTFFTDRVLLLKWEGLQFSSAKCVNVCLIFETTSATASIGNERSEWSLKKLNLSTFSVTVTRLPQLNGHSYYKCFDAKKRCSKLAYWCNSTTSSSLSVWQECLWPQGLVINEWSMNPFNSPISQTTKWVVPIE